MKHVSFCIFPAIAVLALIGCSKKSTNPPPNPTQTKTPITLGLYVETMEETKINNTYSTDEQTHCDSNIVYGFGNSNVYSQACSPNTNCIVNASGTFSQDASNHFTASILSSSGGTETVLSGTVDNVTSTSFRLTESTIRLTFGIQ